jgi:hypothetical protein
MLQWTPITVQLTGGIDSKTSSKTVIQSKLIDLRNGQFDHPGEIGKRVGISALGYIAPGTNTETVIPYGNDILALSDGLLRQPASSSTWRTIGPALGWDVSQSPVLADSGSQITADYAAIGNLRCYVYEDSIHGASYQIQDKTTDSVLIRAALPAGGTQYTVRYPKVVVYGNQFFVFAVRIVAGVGYMVVYTVNTSSPTATPTLVAIDASYHIGSTGAQYSNVYHLGMGTGVVALSGTPVDGHDVLLTIDNAGTGFSLAVDGATIDADSFVQGVPYDLGDIDPYLSGVLVTFVGSFSDGDSYYFTMPGWLYAYDCLSNASYGPYVCWNTTTVPYISHHTTGWASTAVDVYTATSGHIWGAIALFEDASHDVFVAFADHTGSRIYCSVYNPNMGLIEGASVSGVLWSGLNARTLCGNAKLGGATGTYTLLATYPGSSTQYDAVGKVVVTAYVTPSAPVLLLGVQIASKFFESRFLALHDSDLQPTYYVIDSADFSVSARIYPRLAGRATNLPFLTSVMGTTDFEIVLPVQNREQSIGGTLTNSTGLNKITLAPTLTDIRTSTQLANTVHIGGGNLLMFDGQSAVEHGFHYYPETLSVTSPSDAPTPILAPADVTASVKYPKIFGYLSAATYHYVVTAATGYGETAPSDDAPIIVDASGSSVLLSWHTVQGAEEYKVYRKDGGTYKYLNTIPDRNTVAVPVATQQYIDDGLATLGVAAPTTNTTGSAVTLPIDAPTEQTPIESDKLATVGIICTANPIAFPLAPTMALKTGGTSALPPEPSPYFGFLVTATGSDGNGNESIAEMWAVDPLTNKPYIQFAHSDAVVTISWTVPPGASPDTTYNVYGGMVRCNPRSNPPILDNNGNPTPIFYLPQGGTGNIFGTPPLTGHQQGTGAVTSFTVSGTACTIAIPDTAFTDTMAGGTFGAFVTITGATTPANNGIFLTTSVNSDHRHLTYTNGGPGVTEAGNFNTKWSIGSSFGLLQSAVVGSTVDTVILPSTLNYSLPSNVLVPAGALTPGNYVYGVTAHTSAGETDILDYQELTLADGTLVSSYSGEIGISWTDVPGVTYYSIYRGAQGSDQADWGFLADVVATGSGTRTFLDSGYTAPAGAQPGAADVIGSKINKGSLQAGTYAYVVTARTKFGETVASPEVTITPSSNNAGVLVKWNKVAGAVGYTVYGRSASKEAFMVALAHGDVNTKWYQGGTCLTWFDDGSVSPSSSQQPPSDNNTQLTDHSYQYCVTYEWTDNLGQVHRSAPSKPIIQGRFTDISGVNTNEVDAPTLTVTSKNDVQVVFYRTVVNGTTFYRVGAMPNSTSTETVTLLDSTTDATLVGNEELYTTGNVLANMAPGPVLYPTIHQNRVFVVDALDRRSVWYSKQVIPGQPVEFSDFLVLTTDEQGGPVTGLASMDNHLVVFRQNQISISNSQGLDNLGDGDDYTDLARIPGDVGCQDPASIVLTTRGVFFRSAKGIYLLDRSLQLSYIGAGVEKYMQYALSLGTLTSDAQHYNGKSTISAVGEIDAALPTFGELLLTENTTGAQCLIPYCGWKFQTGESTFQLLGTIPSALASTLTIQPIVWGANSEFDLTNGAVQSVITSAVAVPDKHQIRFTIMGFPIILVYDWLVQQWSTYTPPFACRVGCLFSSPFTHQALYTVLDEEGIVRQDEPGTFTDSDDYGDSWITTLLTTAHIKLAGFTGFQRCRLIHVLGDKGAEDFVLSVQVQADYDTSDRPIYSVDTADWFQAKSTLQARVQPIGEIQKGEAIQVTIFDSNPDNNAADQGMTLTGLTLEIGQKRGQKKLSGSHDM